MNIKKNTKCIRKFALYKNICSFRHDFPNNKSVNNFITIITIKKQSTIIYTPKKVFINSILNSRHDINCSFQQLTTLKLPFRIFQAYWS